MQFKVKVTKNSHRRKSPKDYVIAVNPEIKKKLQLKNYAVVSRDVINNNSGNVQNLATSCKIIEDKEATTDFIFIDQSLREALAIPFNYNYEEVFVNLHPLKISPIQRFKKLFVSLLDRRYVFFRCFSGVIFDIEKNISRSYDISYEILGIENGGKIVLEGYSFIPTTKSYELRTITVTLFALPNDWTPKQNNLTAFNLQRDILPITLDARMREDLGIDLLSCVKGRRNVLKLFIEEFRTSGILTILALVTILEILPVDLGSWFSLIPNLVYIVFITFLLMIINIRSSLK